MIVVKVGVLVKKNNQYGIIIEVNKDGSFSVKWLNRDVVLPSINLHVNDVILIKDLVSQYRSHTGDYTLTVSFFNEEDIIKKCKNITILKDTITDLMEKRNFFFEEWYDNYLKNNFELIDEKIEIFNNHVQYEIFTNDDDEKKIGYITIEG